MISLTWISLLIAVLLPLLVIRWARWLAILQQKEYRFDRLLAFIESDEGLRELFRLWPQRRDFQRTGFKRPKPTPRILLIAAGSAVLLLIQLAIAVLAAGRWPLVTATSVWQQSAYLASVYLIVPVTVVVVSLPSILISTVVTQRTLRQAQRLIKIGKPQVIGVGGSYGKTSTKHLLHHFLQQKYQVFVTPKSFNTKLSVAQSIRHGYRRQAIAILEYGAYTRGEIAFLTRWFPPQLVIETGFTPQHLSLFGSRENSILAESELVAALPANGVVFCNGADPGAVEICQVGAAVSGVEVVMYAGPQAAVELTDVRVDRYGQLNVGWHGHRLQTSLIGRQYAINLQGAIAVSQHLGLTAHQIQAAVESFRPNASFIQGYHLPSGAYLIDDGGTSNPRGFTAALELLAELPYRRRLIITAGMVDLGTETHQIHFQLAQRARELDCTVVHLGIDGRSEFSQVYDQELLTSIEAGLVALQQTDADTVVLIEGKVPSTLEEWLHQHRRPLTAKEAHQKQKIRRN